jgi:hypothetical protein
LYHALELRIKARVGGGIALCIEFVREQLQLRHLSRFQHAVFDQQSIQIWNSQSAIRPRGRATPVLFQCLTSVGSSPRPRLLMISAHALLYDLARLCARPLDRAARRLDELARSVRPLAERLLAA